MRRYLVVGCLVLGLAACSDDAAEDTDVVEQPDTTPAAEPGIQFAPQLGIVLDSMSQTPSGVYYRDVQVGRGATATSGKTVRVEYRAWLPDGTLFEERPNAEGWGPSEFRLGVSAPVPGLNEALEGMRTGGVRRIVIPPPHGYGLVGRPAGVPENSTVVFEVKLTDVRDS